MNAPDAERTAAGSPTGPATDAPEQTREEAREQAQSRTAADMVRTLAVVLAVVVGLVLLVPRPNQITQPQVDVANAALGASSAGFPLSVPRGLPPGWQATSARLQRGTDGVTTWHVGYVTPSGNYAAFEQAGSPTRAWENTQVTDGPERGRVQVAGASWVVRSRTDRGITSWVLRRPGLTTIVTGTADAAELAVLAASLHLS